MTTGDKNATIRQNNSVRETTRIGHVGDTLDLGRSVGFTNGRDVGTGIGIRVSVVGRTTGAEDFSSSGIVHDKDTAHGIINRVSDTSSHLRTLACCSVPVHGLAGSGLEYRLVLPAEEPCVVVLTPNTFVVPGKHWSNLRVRKSSPRVGDRVVDFAVLAHAGARIRASDGEDTVVRCSAG